MILVTESYNVVLGNGVYVVKHIAGGYDVFVTTAINTTIQGFGSIFITAAMGLFTFTTIMAYSMYLSRIYYYFFSDQLDKPIVKVVSVAINVATVTLGFIGPLVHSTLIWNMASALCGLLSLVNLACLALLYKPGIATLRDYERQLAKGIEPVFIPENCHIKDAELWHTIIQEDYSEELSAYHQAFPKE